MSLSPSNPAPTSVYITHTQKQIPCSPIVKRNNYTNLMPKHWDFFVKFHMPKKIIHARAKINIQYNSTNLHIRRARIIHNFQNYYHFKMLNNVMYLNVF